VQSQARLVARHRGLVRVRADAVDASLAWIHLRFHFDGWPGGGGGEEVAGCKVTPVAVPAASSRRPKRSARAGPSGRGAGVPPLKTFVVATERLKPKARELFRQAVTAKLGWYGAELLGVREVARTTEAWPRPTKRRRLVAPSSSSCWGFRHRSTHPAYAELTRAGGRSSSSARRCTREHVVAGKPRRSGGRRRCFMCRFRSLQLTGPAAAVRLCIWSSRRQ